MSAMTIITFVSATSALLWRPCSSCVGWKMRMQRRSISQGVERSLGLWWRFTFVDQPLDGAIGGPQRGGL